MTHLPTEDEPLDVTETRQVRRITMAHVFRSVVDAFNVDRGGVFTIKQLFINPGATVRDYLGANRYHYVPPFRILIITTAVALFLVGISDFIDSANIKFSTDLGDAVEASGEDRIDATAAMALLLAEIQGYFNLILWTYIPFAAFFSWLINLKQNFNFAEHTVFQAYLFSIANILSFLSPLDHFIPWWILISVIYIFMIFYYIYAYKQFLRKSWFRAIFEMIFIFVLSSIIWSVLLGVSFGVILSLRM